MFADATNEAEEDQRGGRTARGGVPSAYHQGCHEGGARGDHDQCEQRPELLHDARQRLKECLLATGISLEDIRSAFDL